MEPHNDQLFLESLGLISRIKPRDYPNDSCKFHFSEENYPDDARMVRAFCRKRSVVAHKSNYISERWDIVNYLSPPYFLYYLPSILIACLIEPKSMHARMVLKFKMPAETEESMSKMSIHYSPEEKEAYWSVANFIRENLAASDIKNEGSSVPQLFEC